MGRAQPKLQLLRYSEPRGFIKITHGAKVLRNQSLCKCQVNKNTGFMSSELPRYRVFGKWVSILRPPLTFYDSQNNIYSP